MVNIFITGIRGFLGSHLADCLSGNEDNNIVGISRSFTRKSTFDYLKLGERKNIKLVYGDLGDIHEIERILIDNDINQVYHLAAETIVNMAAKNPISTCKVNIFGTLNVLEAIRNGINKQQQSQIDNNNGKNKIDRILVMSSDKSYGYSDKLPYKENYCMNGLDIYSASKSCQDIISRSYFHEYNLPVVVARSANIYGPFDTNYSRIIPNLIKKILDGEQITIYKSTSNQIREYVYVKDVVKALVMLIDKIDYTKGHAYNITSGERYTVEQILDVFKQVTGNILNINYVGAKVDKGFKEIGNQYLDGTKLKNLGWDKQYNFIMGITDIFAKHEIEHLAK